MQLAFAFVLHGLRWLMRVLIQSGATFYWNLAKKRKILQSQTGVSQMHENASVYKWALRAPTYTKWPGGTFSPIKPLKTTGSWNEAENVQPQEMLAWNVNSPRVLYWLESNIDTNRKKYFHNIHITGGFFLSKIAINVFYLCTLSTFTVFFIRFQLIHLKRGSRGALLPLKRGI